MKDPVLYEENGSEQNKQGREAKGISLKSVILLAVIALFAFFIVNSQLLARSPGSGGWSGFGGSCCGPGPTEVSTEQIRQAGLEYYRANYGDEAVEAVVQDYGCHQEVHIYKEGRLIKRLYYLNGRIDG